MFARSVFTLALAATSAAAAREPADRPNVVLVVADDLGYTLAFITRKRRINRIYAGFFGFLKVSNFTTIGGNAVQLTTLGYIIRDGHPARRFVAAGLVRWRDTACWHATTTSDELLPRRLRCNNGIRDDWDERAARSLSTGSDVGSNMQWELARAVNQDTLKAGPRGEFAPEGQASAKRQLRTEAILCAVVLWSAARWRSSLTPLL